MGLFNKLCLRTKGSCSLALTMFSEMLNVLNPHRVTRKQGPQAACWKGTIGLENWKNCEDPRRICSGNNVKSPQQDQET